MNKYGTSLLPFYSACFLHHTPTSFFNLWPQSPVSLNNCGDVVLDFKDPSPLIATSYYIHTLPPADLQT